MHNSIKKFAVAVIIHTG